MGRIKSALELALERTEQIQGDKGSLEQHEAKQQGKKLANEYLEGADGAPDAAALEAAVKKTADTVKTSFKQGLLEVFLARISMPRDDTDVKRLETLGKGLQTVTGNPRLTALWKQFQGAAARYLDEAAGYEDAIMRQYAPQLRQKEAELSRRLGQQVRLDPFQDPEFVAFYNKNMDNFKSGYEAVVQDMREQVQNLAS
ncbi:MAG: hypothetical protein LBJ86_06950 [Spirochaetaceae bacterium]|jgi:hypothetical protein|nr:hypothetical protein [Spirochaetaceae bacterium]